MALKKIQDGIRFNISLQKSIDWKILLQKSLSSQCCRLQARLKKLKCQNFPILKNFNMSKTQNFQNSPKIWVFIIDTNIQRKSCYNLYEESPKKNWLESENPWFWPLAAARQPTVKAFSFGITRHVLLLLHHKVGLSDQCPLPQEKKLCISRESNPAVEVAFVGVNHCTI
jgi:hypothetical protein